LTPRRADARRTEEEAVRRHGEVGESANDDRETAGATPVRTTLAPGEPEPPEMGVLQPLARVLVDLAVAQGHEDEEDEQWTR